MSLYSSKTLSPVHFSLGFLTCDILTRVILPTHPWKPVGLWERPFLILLVIKKRLLDLGLLFSKIQDANSASTGRPWNEPHIPWRLPGESLLFQTLSKVTFCLARGGHGTESAAPPEPRHGACPAQITEASPQSPKSSHPFSHLLPAASLKLRKYHLLKGENWSTFDASSRTPPPQVVATKTISRHCEILMHWGCRQRQEHKITPRQKQCSSYIRT